MSLSAAQRLLRPSSNVGGSARHALGLGGAASQRSESQRSDESGFTSARSHTGGGGATGKPLLLAPPGFGTASNYGGGAEHSALCRRVQDHQAALTEQAALIKRLEAKLDRSLEAQSQFRQQVEHELADVRGALPEMMRTLVGSLRDQITQSITDEFARLASSLAHDQRKRESAAAAASPPLATPPNAVLPPTPHSAAPPHTPSHAPTRKSSPSGAPHPPSRHRPATVVEPSPPSAGTAAPLHPPQQAARGRKRKVLSLSEHAPQPPVAAAAAAAEEEADDEDDAPPQPRAWGTLLDLRLPADAPAAAADKYEEGDEGGTSASGEEEDEELLYDDFDLFEHDGGGGGGGEAEASGGRVTPSAPPPSRAQSAPPSAYHTTPIHQHKKTPSPQGSAGSASSSHYTPISLPSRQYSPNDGSAPNASRHAVASSCAGRLEKLFDGMETAIDRAAGGLLATRAVGPNDSERRDCRLSEYGRTQHMQMSMGMTWD